jgi:hypothetical protein
MNGEKSFLNPVSSMMEEYKKYMRREFSEPMNILINWIKNGLEGYKSHAINCVIEERLRPDIKSPWEECGKEYLEFANNTFGYQSEQMTEFNLKNTYTNYCVPLPNDIMDEVRMNSDILADFRGKLNKTQDKSDLSVFTEYGSFHVLLNKRLSRSAEIYAYAKGINVIYLTDNWIKINRNLDSTEACDLLLFLAKNNREICIFCEPVGLGGIYRSNKIYRSSIDDGDSEYGNIKMELGRYKFPGIVMRTENEVSRELIKMEGVLKIDRANRKHIPNAIRLFKKLTTLEITNCKLLYVPNYMFTMDTISILNLNLNKFTCIPEVICYMKNLQVLNMANNRISKVTSRISNLQNLSMLLLSNNLIETLPKEITDVKSLEILDLTNNTMKEINVRIEEFPNMKEFHI